MAANSSDEICNFKCTSCLNLNRECEAVKYCVDCQGYCCQSCVDMHRAFDALKNHSILDKFSFTSSVFATSLPDVPTERCRRHDRKVTDMYCANHDVVGCSACMISEHRKCTDLHSIADDIDIIFKESEVTRTHHIIKEKMKILEKRKETKEGGLIQLKESKDSSLQDIRRMKKEIVALIESMEEESIKKLQSEYCRREALFKDEINKTEKELAEIRQKADGLNKSNGNKAQKFVLTKSTQKRIAQTDLVLAKFNEQTQATLEFSIETSILNFLRDYKTFGQVKSYYSDSLDQHTSAYSVKGSREMNIRLQNDSSRCRVKGMCLTPVDLLLLADYNNNKLKRADLSRMTITDYCDLSQEPEDVCSISQNEAAVSLIDNTIQFISLGKQMVPTRQLKLDHRCYGIAYNGSKLYVTTNSSMLYIYSLSGNLIQTVSTDNAQNILFQQNQHVEFSDDGEKVFVVDYRRGLITLDTKGNRITKFKINPELSEIHDVCTDKRGSLFVSDLTLNTVIQISQDGKRKVGDVVRKSDGIIGPYCVCFDHLRNVLIIIQLLNDNVKLFDLQ